MPAVVQAEEGQSREEALVEAFCWSLGVDGTFGWHEELPSAESLRHPVEDWVARVARQRGVWPRQRAAISALVLHSASPAEARSEGGVPGVSRKRESPSGLSLLHAFCCCCVRKRNEITATIANPASRTSHTIGLFSK
jgi:hypothetical protein